MAKILITKDNLFSLAEFKALLEQMSTRDSELDDLLELLRELIAFEDRYELDSTVKIIEHPETLRWDYDDADVLYLSISDPKPAVGIDIGDGVILRLNEAENSVVGLTIIGLRERMMKEQVQMRELRGSFPGKGI